MVIAVDILENRLALAKELGATHAVNSREVGDIAAHIKSLTPSTNGANFAVDCTGVPVVIEAMLNCLTQLGTAAQVGVPPANPKVNNVRNNGPEMEENLDAEPPEEEGLFPPENSE